MKGKTIFLYGLPCSGKTTIARRIFNKFKNSIRIVHLDGDDIRKRLNNDLGFSDEDRKRNIERIANVCQLLNEYGINVICSFVAPTKEIRQILKNKIDNIYLIYVNTPLKICIERDVKGMYEKAIKGEIKEFTGIDGVFEEDDNDPYILGNLPSIEDSIKMLLNIVSFDVPKSKFSEKLLKTFGYRIFSSMVLGSLAYFFTGNVNVLIGVLIIDLILKFSVYLIYEYIWEYLKFKINTR